MSAKWPTAVATDADLYTAVNLLQTTLSGTINSAVTTITLTSTSGFPTAGAVTIDNEVIFYTNISGANLTGCTRGSDGTSAASHNSGVPVGATIVAFHHNGLMAEIEALESDLHTRIGFGSTNQLVLANGVVGAPTVSWAATSNTGIWSRAANLVTISSNGVQVAEFGTNLEITGAYYSDLTSNQLILGTTRTITITAPTPATSSRTWTIPDITGNGTFASREAIETFTALKTFQESSSNTTFASEAGTVVLENTSATTNNYAGMFLEESHGNGVGYVGVQITAHASASASTGGEVIIATKAQGTGGGPVIQARVKEAGQLYLTSAGTVSLPAVAITDANLGFYRTASQQIGVTLGGAKAAEFVSTGSADDTAYMPLKIVGGNASSASFEQYTSSITTSAKIICDFTAGGNCAFIMVYGDDGAGNRFADLIFATYAANTPSTVVTKTSLGSPAARTYSMSANGVVKLTMASGTYSVHTLAIALN